MYWLGLCTPGTSCKQMCLCAKSAVCLGKVYDHTTAESCQDLTHHRCIVCWFWLAMRVAGPCRFTRVLHTTKRPFCEDANGGRATPSLSGSRSSGWRSICLILRSALITHSAFFDWNRTCDLCFVADSMYSARWYSLLWCCVLTICGTALLRPEV